MAHSTTVTYKGETIPHIDYLDDMQIGSKFFDEDPNDENKIQICEITAIDEDKSGSDLDYNAIYYKGSKYQFRVIDWLFDRV